MNVVPFLPAGDRSWTLEHPRRALPMNAFRKLHPQAAAVYTREWREAFGWLARAARIPRLDAAVITVAQGCDRPPLPDPGSTYPTAKAAIDGLVDAGVLADDDGRHLRLLQFLPAERVGRDVFVLIVSEVPA